MYRVGVIKHRQWMNELKDELIKFPAGKTVDIIDALSFQLVIKSPTDTETQELPYKRLIDRMTEMQKNQNGDTRDQGRELAHRIPWITPVLMPNWNWPAWRGRLLTCST